MPAPNDVLEFSAVALSSVFFTVDPLGAIPAFLVMGVDHDESTRRRAARRAALTCFLVLTAFAMAGTLIFKTFGITLPAFQIAGGLLLFQLAMQMLQARRSGTQESEEERAEGREKDDFGLFPLGIPMLAGPASISAVMVLMAQSRLWWQAIPVYAAIALTCAASFLILRAGMRVRRFLGETGMRVMVRMMGLVLAAMAVQFVINGVTDLWPSLMRSRTPVSVGPDIVPRGAISPALGRSAISRGSSDARGTADASDPPSLSARASAGHRISPSI